ncbi:VWA domain-containing protein [uncultured Porphyromonas sp.]|uniref:vWA domain-containing protein n=1 Tax=uncultured Porphyromonas sp. TaxID=159274 RepID=UPI0028063789|nr:VWA domain-containing protein [uncultured Porphyromonas sp.]
MIWVHPEWLWALLLLPLLVLLYIRYNKRHQAKLSLSAYRLLPKGSGWRSYLRALPFVLELLALASMILALARPQDSSHWEERSIQGIDLVLAMDLSGSMQALDLKPNRFEAARDVANEMIAARPNDNIGLVVFAGESFTLCPLTVDHDVILQMLDATEIGQLEDGTAIGLGLATAINTLRGSDNKSKVIILLTDGSNNAGDITPSMAAELAQQYGIRIYTVAAGTNGVAKFPVQTASGIEYVEADVQIDEGTLRHIAQQTGGKYYRATDETKLHEIYKEIDSLEKSRLTSRSVSAYEERYMLFALLAIVLLGAAFLLRTTLLRANP